MELPPSNIRSAHARSASKASGQRIEKAAALHRARRPLHIPLRALHLDKGGCTASPPHMGAGRGVNAASLLFISFSVAHFLHFLLTSERRLRIILFVACRCSSSGRAPPCQGGGSEFEPRCPLQKETPTLETGVGVSLQKKCGLFQKVCI